MKFTDFKIKFSNILLINQQQIKLFDPSFDDTQLHRWQKKKYLKKISKGFYVFADQKLDDTKLYHIACNLYQPSYLSLESALSIYGLIPEAVITQTCVSTKKNRLIESEFGMFSYRNIKESLFWGYKIEELNQVKYKIARLEKAVLDYLYLNSHINSIQAFEDIRFDGLYFKEIYNDQIFSEYLGRFASKALNKRVAILKEFINHA